MTRGPHVEKRRWKDRRSGLARESRFWFLVFYRNGRRVHVRTKPPTESKRIALEQLHRTLSGGLLPGEHVTTASTVLDTYAQHLEANAASTYAAKGGWLLWWRKRWLGRTAETITRADVDGAVLALQRADLQPGTIGGYLSVLRASFRRAAADGVISADHPLSSLRVAFASPERHVTWTDAELVRVMGELPVWARHLVALLRSTGIRVGAALALRWENVHEKHLRFRSEKPDRDLVKPLSHDARRLLEAIPRVSAWVFPNDALTGPKRKSSLLRLWAPALRRAKVAGKTVHDIRRTWAQALHDSGASHATIATGLGQKTTQLVPLYTRTELAAVLRAEENAGSRAAVAAAVAAAVEQATEGHARVKLLRIRKWKTRSASKKRGR